MDRLVKICVAFMISFVVHGVADYMALGGPLITRNFFIYQPIGFGIEYLAAWTVKRLGLSPPFWLRRLIGYIWVLVWFTWCGVPVMDGMVRSGVIADMARIVVKA